MPFGGARYSKGKVSFILPHPRGNLHYIMYIKPNKQFKQFKHLFQIFTTFSQFFKYNFYHFSPLFNLLTLSPLRLPWLSHLFPSNHCYTGKLTGFNANYSQTRLDWMPLFSPLVGPVLSNYFSVLTKWGSTRLWSLTSDSENSFKFSFLDVYYSAIFQGFQLLHFRAF